MIRRVLNIVRRDAIHAADRQSGLIVECQDSGFQWALVDGITNEHWVRVGGDEKEFDVVKRPEHYNSHPSGLECIQVAQWFNFNLGCVIKYIWRTDHKNGLEDLEKAKQYLEFEIARVKGLPVRGS